MCLWHGRDQVQDGAFVVAEIRPRSAATAWPRSGPGRRRLRGRVQVALCAFCVAEVRWCSVTSAWPRSSRALWGMLGRGHVNVGGFSRFLRCAHGVFGVPLSCRFEAGGFFVLQVPFFWVRRGSSSSLVCWWQWRKIPCFICSAWSVDASTDRSPAMRVSHCFLAFRALVRPLWVLGLGNSGSLSRVFTCIWVSSRLVLALVLRRLSDPCLFGAVRAFFFFLEASFEDRGAFLHPLKVWSFLKGQSMGSDSQFGA